LALNIGSEPAPQLAALWTQSGLQLSFLALVNHHYTVEWTDRLSGANNWTALISNLAGNGATETVTDTVTNAPGRFYRLVVLTP